MSTKMSQKLWTLADPVICELRSYFHTKPLNQRDDAQPANTIRIVERTNERTTTCMHANTFLLLARID